MTMVTTSMDDWTSHCRNIQSQDPHPFWLWTLPTILLFPSIWLLLNETCKHRGEKGHRCSSSVYTEVTLIHHQPQSLPSEFSPPNSKSILLPHVNFTCLLQLLWFCGFFTSICLPISQSLSLFKRTLSKALLPSSSCFFEAIRLTCDQSTTGMATSSHLSPS